MKEFWKDIPGYEGIYRASNTGKIKSLSRVVSIGNNKRIVPEKILTPEKSIHGYLRVKLSKGKSKRYFVHRIVALTYLPNPNGYDCINHKDETQTNNFVFINNDGSVNPEKSNLEWCTRKYNTNYGTCLERAKKTRLVNRKVWKRVEQLDLNGNHIAYYPSIKDAQSDNKIRGCHVSECCRGIRKSANGFIWRYY